MSDRLKIDFVTVVPSPYQRDLLGALDERPEVDLRVFYMEASAPDSPWPQKPLRRFETILRGSWFTFGGARWHVNRDLPDFSTRDFVVVNSYVSATTQWLMRGPLRHRRWLFWGERVRPQSTLGRRAAQEALLRPLRHAAAIVGMGRAATEDYQRRFPNQRHFCIPYFCDLSAFMNRRRIRRPDEPVTFLFCGQMIRRKGVDLLLNAFDQLIGTATDARLILVGREADLPAFMKAVAPATRERIEYRGFKAPEDLADEFARPDVFVLPSRHDGWGVVVNQALGAGLPVIASDAVGAGLDLVEPEGNGLLFAAGDTQGLLACLERLARNPELARIWGDRSRERAASLSPAVGAEAWVNVFDSLRLAQGEAGNPRHVKDLQHSPDAVI
jgi:glycosyltransferase involved in cell wall biosynthesis